MRKPTANERRLMLIFGAAIFVFLNLLVLRWYSGAWQKLADEVRQLDGTLGEFRALLEERPHWEARRQWVLAHPPELHAGRESDSRFAEAIQRTLTESGLTIDSQQLRESERAGTLVTTTLELSVKGRMEPLIRWLNLVQQPGSYFAVENFTLKCLDDGTTMTGHVRIRKIFRTGEVAANP